MSQEKTQSQEPLQDADAPTDLGKREVLARLGKYAAYTAPVMLITLGAAGRKAEAQSGASDRRLKRNIELLTTLADGTKLYSFRYLWSDDVFVGVMAQDLLADPAKRHAVILGQSGYFQVDYAKLGLRMAKLEEWSRVGLSCVLRAGERATSLPATLSGRTC